MDSPNKRKALILIIVAVLLAALVAAAVMKVSGNAKNKKYNDNIAIAEKAMAEGDYEAAEAGYLGAIEIRDKDIPAREGLAYVYTLEGKFEEAEKEYLDLFEETDDSKYSDAADDVRNGYVPVDPEITPAKGVWRDVDKFSLAEGDSLAYFLVWFNQMYYYGESEADILTKEYDSENPTGSNLLNIALYFANQMGYPGSGTSEFVQGMDPRGWMKWEDFGHLVMDKPDVDWMLTNIFNVSEENIAKLLDKSESERILYLQDGKYYDVNYIITGFGVLAVEVDSIRTDGRKYIVEYEVGLPANWEATEGIGVRLDRSYEILHYYAVMELKELEEGTYWSIYSNSEQAPEA